MPADVATRRSGPRRHRAHAAYLRGFSAAIAASASAPLLRLGHCRGAAGDMTPFTIGTERSLLQLAFPERNVTLVPLSKTCERPHEAAPGDAGVDVLFLVGWNFDEQFKDAVIAPRKAAKQAAKKQGAATRSGSDDLLYYFDSTMQPKHHNSNRPVTIGMNVEFHNGRNFLFDVHQERAEPAISCCSRCVCGWRLRITLQVMIDSVWRGHSDGIGLYWPGMSRNAFFPGLQSAGALFQHSIHELVHPATPPKTRFAAFMVSACDLKCAANSRHFVAPPRLTSCRTVRYHRGASSTLRVALFDKLAADYQRPDSLSQCRSDDPALKRFAYGGQLGTVRTPERRVNGTNSGRSFLDIAVERYQPYRFVFAMENHIGPQWTGWATERLVTATLAGAVPIVAGTAATRAFLGQFINLERVLFCEMPAAEGSMVGKRVPQFDANRPEARVQWAKEVAARDISDCAELIRRVDQDPARWQHIVNQPLVNGSVEHSIFGAQRIAANLRNAICRDLESHLCTSST
jgi:hypothetical protein